MRIRSDNSENSVKAKAMNSHKSVPPKNSEPSPSFEDPIVKEVRNSRHALALECGNDLQKVVSDLMRRQEKLGNRLRHLAQ
jgi:hypothetical protein